MGFDFTSRQGEAFRFSVWEWRATLELARDFGWLPKGTLAPDDYDPDDDGGFSTKDVVTGQRVDFDVPGDGRRGAWSGTYSTNDGQVVTDEDAASMADAIERALTEIGGFFSLTATHPEIYLAVMNAQTDNPRSPAPVVTDDDGAPDLMPMLIKVGIFNQCGLDGIPQRHPAQVLLEHCESSWEEYLEKFVRYCRRGGFAIW
jgi:hypothetical protein